MRNLTHNCPSCGGDGIETCHNPDHGLINALSFHDTGRFGCPVCGHHPKHKVKYKGAYGQCKYCSGVGRVTVTEAFLILVDENIDGATDDYINNTGVTILLPETK